MNKTNTLPRISVITPTLNQGRYIEHTIQSVIAQDYPDFEHVVIDGGSTDETPEILKKYPHVKWISEKDNGQGDALNKGAALISGEIVAWLNSDDYYCVNAFHTIANTFAMNPHVKALAGQTLLLFEKTMMQIPSQNREMGFEDMLRYWDEWVPPTQPSVFFRRSLFNEIGLFDTSLHYTMDLDFWLRICLEYKIYSIPETLAVYRFHKESKSGFADWSSFFPEYNLVYRRYKKHSTVLPGCPLATLAIPLSETEFEKSPWYLEKVKNVLRHLASQKIHDIEALVITDINEPEVLPDLTSLPFPARLINVGKLDGQSFYQALTRNATGFAIHCPPIDIPFDVHWFSTALTFLLKNQDTPMYVADSDVKTAHTNCDTGITVTAGFTLPNKHILVRREVMKVLLPFTFPVTDTPVITFIVHVNDNILHRLFNSLYSIYEHCKDYPFEVICITERGGKADYLHEICNAAIIETDTGTDLFEAINDAANSARGEYLFFMSSTIVLTPGAVPAIIETFENYPRAGITGGKTVYPTGVVDNAGCIAIANGIALKYGWGKPKGNPPYEYLRETAFFSTDFLGIKQEAWKKTCGFDTGYSPWSCQDADLCFSVSTMGYSIIYQPRAEVYNYDVSALDTLQGGTKEYNLTDSIRFKEKWKGRIEERLSKIDDALIERASVIGNKPWMLFLCHKLLIEDLTESASSGNIGRHLESFKASGFNVAVYTEETSLTESHKWLRRRGFKVFYNDVDFNEFLKDNVLNFDVIWMEGRGTALGRTAIIRRLFNVTMLIYNASTIDAAEDFSTVTNTDNSALKRLQVSRDRLIAEMVDVAYTESEEYGKYLASLNQALTIRLITPDVGRDTMELMKHISVTVSESKYRNGAEIYGNILKLENAIKEIARQELQKIVDNSEGRPLYIWGAGRGGTDTRRLLSSLGAEATAYLDKNPDKWLTLVDALPVYDPYSVLIASTTANRPFVVIGSIYGSAISAELIELGYENEKDFAINSLL